MTSEKGSILNKVQDAADNKIIDQFKILEPTTQVRVRPYLYEFISNSILMVQDQEPLQLLPQGNYANGNRVTWGWQIRILFLDPLSLTNGVFFNGSTLTMAPGTGIYELVNTLNNPGGIDTTQYQIASLNNPGFYVHYIQQTLKLQPV